MLTNEINLKFKANSIFFINFKSVDTAQNSKARLFNLPLIEGPAKALGPFSIASGPLR